MRGIYDILPVFSGGPFPPSSVWTQNKEHRRHEQGMKVNGYSSLI